jgi:hypothetical protein
MKTTTADWARWSFLLPDDIYIFIFNTISHTSEKQTPWRERPNLSDARQASTALVHYSVPHIRQAQMSGFLESDRV